MGIVTIKYVDFYFDFLEKLLQENEKYQLEKSSKKLMKFVN